MIADLKEIKQLLDQKVVEYNRSDFIVDDPVSIPHHFTQKEDIEISAFLTSMIAWGQRKTIITNARKLMELMDFSPHDFIINSTISDLHHFKDFRHRTFNGDDCILFLQSLQNIYLNYGGIETVLSKNGSIHKIPEAITHFRDIFFSVPHESRSRKHIPDPSKGSAAKRFNMFLRWMVRNDANGVDFGIWKSFSPADLYCPLDVHSGEVARSLGILNRKQNDWIAAEELTSLLRQFDPLDPVKYDFALFGLGIHKQI